MERAEAPITNHLRDYAPNLEKYKEVPNFPMYEDRNQEDSNCFGKFILIIEITMNFEAESWPEHITNV